MPALSDVQYIFIVLAGLYLFDALVWIRPGTTALVRRRRWFGGTTVGRDHVALATRLTGNDTGQLVWAGLPPWSSLWLIQPPPLSVGSDGIAPGRVTDPLGSQPPMPGRVGGDPSSNDAGSSHCRPIDWTTAARVVQRAGSLWAGDVDLGRIQTKVHAAAIADDLRRIARFDGRKREEAIESWHRDKTSFDRVDRQIASWREATGPVRVAATALFVWTFGVGGVLAWSPPAIDGIWLAGRAVVVGGFLIVFAFWWAMSLFLGFIAVASLDDDRDTSLSSVGMAILSPPLAMRLGDTVGRRLLIDLDPVAVLARTDRDRTAEHVGLALRDARHPAADRVAAASESSAIAIYQQDQQRSQRFLMDLAVALKIDPAPLIAAPKPEDAQSDSFCPRCHQQFDEPSTCDQCGGLATVGLAAGRGGGRQLASDLVPGGSEARGDCSEKSQPDA